MEAEQEGFLVFFNHPMYLMFFLSPFSNSDLLSYIYEFRHIKRRQIIIPCNSLMPLLSPPYFVLPLEFQQQY